MQGQDIDDWETAWANARLIAAAPNMLQALKNAERLMSFLHWDAMEARSDKFTVLVAVRDAIAKATGESE